MTRTEFIQQAVLAQLGNARCYSGVSHTRDAELREIMTTAKRLADEVETVAHFAPEM